MNRSKKIGLVVLALGGSVATANDGASAQTAPSYPFCGVYVNKSGTPGCYFATRQQCMADVSGVGGFCIENRSYQTPPATTARTKLAKRAHRGGQSH